MSPNRPCWLSSAWLPPVLWHAAKPLFTVRSNAPRGGIRAVGMHRGYVKFTASAGFTSNGVNPRNTVQSLDGGNGV